MTLLPCQRPERLRASAPLELPHRRARRAFRFIHPATPADTALELAAHAAGIFDLSADVGHERARRLWFTWVSRTRVDPVVRPEQKESSCPAMGKPALPYITMEL
jgi:hypothetical protein